MAQFTAVLRTIGSSARHLLAVLAALGLLLTGLGGTSTSLAQQRPDRPPLGAEQLDQLMAPIALYPDNLLGQILAASTYPLEVVIAARWSAANPNMSGSQLEDAMQQQTWDPSVKALTAVPQVLQMMSDKVEWTYQLGDAYLAQPDDIAVSVQRLRARADASGNLKETSKLKVKRVKAPPPPPDVVYVAAPPPEYIIIEPYEPNVIFVPVYDPFLVYGVWPYAYYRPFYWYPRGYVAVGLIGFGAPCLVGAAVWANYNWYSRRVVINVVHYNKFNRVALANTAANQSWKHDGKHRGNLSYSTAKLQQQYGKPSGQGASQKVLNIQGAGQQGIAKLKDPKLQQGTTGTQQGVARLKDPKLQQGAIGTQQGVARLKDPKLQQGTNTGKPPTINNRTAVNRTGVSGNRQLVGGQNMQLRQGMNVRSNTGYKPNANVKPNPNVRQGNKPY